MEPVNQTPSKNIEVNEQVIREIYDNTRKTKSYMKWQLIITVALVVIPILAMVFIIPMVLSSLTSLTGAAGLLQ